MIGSDGHLVISDPFHNELYEENEQTYNPPQIDVGDEIKIGKFKNRKAEVTGFKKDENNQPVLKTTKGDQKLFKPRLTKLMNEVKIDNYRGWGQTPNNQDIDYFGLRVLMKPSVFLRLALPLDEPTSKNDIIKHLKNGGAIGAPTLYIIIPAEWEKNKFTKKAKIKTHEGRNRMMAIEELYGDVPVEVHLIPEGGMRARHITPEIIQNLNTILIPESGSGWFYGPYFDIEHPELAENWRHKVAGATLAGTLAYGVGSNYLHQRQTDQLPTTQPVQTAQQPEKEQLSEPEQLKKYLINQARQAGILGNELLHFISQCAHETMNFMHLSELGGSQYISKKYDLKHSPNRAKMLGNTQVGDGEKFKGRGFIQITGRYNYKMAGDALGLPLEENPELAEDPEVAAEIAIWYWKKRVQPKIPDFNKVSVGDVTKPINAKLHGIKSRINKYNDIKKDIQ
jgi:predicted chitinase